MRTSTENLEGNKVKLTIEVDEADVLKVHEETIQRLAREARVPGFRPGRVPRRIIEVRLGQKAIREEVLNDALPRYYEEAVEETDLDVIAPPEIEVTSGQDEGPVVFDAVVEVRPEVSVAGYEGLVITVPRPHATDEEIDAQIDKMRDQFAALSDVDRPVADGDLVTIDVHGTRDGEPADGLTADDIVYQVGSGGITEELDARLTGTKAGDEFELEAEDAPGGPAHLDVAVKQVREKTLPEADDAFASDASEFDTLAELREDLGSRLDSVKRYQATVALRQEALEALLGLVEEEPPETLVTHEREHLAEEFLGRLNQQRASFDDYLQAMGQDQESFLAELTGEATKQVKADLALRALAKAEEIVVEESDIDDEIVRIASQVEQAPADVRRAIEQNGRMAGLRSELQRAKAMQWLLDHIAIVDPDGKTMDREELQHDLQPMGDGHDHDGHDHEGHDHDHAHDDSEEG
ncbi:MAG TPA: trigger factor [Acidimicrobiales bacterium]|nr:trigger factor [Acidimicrobiales bacterium]